MPVLSAGAGEAWGVGCQSKQWGSFLLLLQGKPHWALELGLSDRNGRDLWETHAITSVFKKEQDIPWHVSEEDLPVVGEDNTRPNKHHKDLT